MNKKDKIHIPVGNGTVLQFDYIAEELFRLFMGAFHSDMFNRPVRDEAAFVSYAFVGISLIWRYQLCTDEDFEVFKKLSLAEQYTAATRYVAVMHEILQLHTHRKELFEEFENLLKEYNEDND